MLALTWTSALLAAWLAAAFALLVSTGAEVLLPVGLAALVLVTAATLLRPRYALAVAGAAAGLFCALWLWLLRDGGNPAVLVALMVGEAGAFVLARAILEQTQALTGRVWDLQQDLATASLRVPDTGALNPGFGREMLVYLVEMARRYQRDLTVLRVGLARPVAHSAGGASADAAALDHALGSLLTKAFRSLDVVVRYQTAEYYVILPETPITGASVVARRLVQALSGAMAEPACVGMAVLRPDMTADTLVEEATATLEFARWSGLTVSQPE